MHAYGIPILSSGLVKDETLRRACYTVRFMLADREDIRRAQYFNGGRIVIMAEYPLEKTTDVPVRVPKFNRTFARGLRGLPEMYKCASALFPPLGTNFKSMLSSKMIKILIGMSVPVVWVEP